jgi:hypothetical protein
LLNGIERCLIWTKLLNLITNQIRFSLWFLTWIAFMVHFWS